MYGPILARESTATMTPCSNRNASVVVPWHGCTKSITSRSKASSWRAGAGERSRLGLFWELSSQRAAGRGTHVVHLRQGEGGAHAVQRLRAAGGGAERWRQDGTASGRTTPRASRCPPAGRGSSGRGAWRHRGGADRQAWPKPHSTGPLARAASLAAPGRRRGRRGRGQQQDNTSAVARCNAAKSVVAFTAEGARAARRL